jgi:hypothetical protein
MSGDFVERARYGVNDLRDRLVATLSPGDSTTPLEELALLSLERTLEELATLAHYEKLRAARPPRKAPT